MRVKQLCFAGEMEDDKAVALIHLIHDDFCPFIEGEDVGGLVKPHRLLVPCAHLSHVVIRWDVYPVPVPVWLLAGISMAFLLGYLFAFAEFSDTDFTQNFVISLLGQGLFFKSFDDFLLGLELFQGANLPTEIFRLVSD
jgi:hypothetical protein